MTGGLARKGRATALITVHHCPARRGRAKALVTVHHEVVWLKGGQTWVQIREEKNNRVSSKTIELKTENPSTVSGVRETAYTSPWVVCVEVF